MTLVMAAKWPTAIRSKLCDSEVASYARHHLLGMHSARDDTRVCVEELKKRVNVENKVKRINSARNEGQH